MKRYNPFEGSQTTLTMPERPERKAAPPKKSTNNPTRSKRLSIKGKTREEYEATIIAAFMSKGIARPKIFLRKNVRTFWNWKKEFGRIVKKGERGVRAGRAVLFHISQTELDPEVINSLD